MENKQLIAEDLLKINAVVLRPDDPFTWASGIHSPVYCDNRLIMGFPDIWQHVIRGYLSIINSDYPDIEVVAGTATSGIPHAALIAEALHLPMVYVRSSAKSHGKGKQIEGTIKPGQKTVVIEDLISTGGSVLKAADALKDAGAEILGVAAIFTYQLPQADKNFERAGVKLKTLTDFNTLIHLAVRQGKISNQQLQQLKSWYSHPESEDWRNPVL
ncbi:orotate phosphoribosyltransferase [Sporolactobacillus sp. THM19-2]|uniref:orotate phosphoribosyltransferase n=1 Tax=Sporolactobacillus sp. THM19-2 TaxID=2511171 RepID=UPI00101ED79E|nr:orotate phosphoribosyltransferase [Sporolactobacillus sp. THM19-2]RYL92898.1 orotate phosphoribosyltransferase [Sporolactobacillus sp. THM19-2]